MGFFLHQLAGLVAGMIDAMGSYLLGQWWARLKFLVGGLTAVCLAMAATAVARVGWWALSKVYRTAKAVAMVITKYLRGNATEYELKCAKSTGTQQ